jgi:hypothetical protein
MIRAILATLLLLCAAPSFAAVVVVQEKVSAGGVASDQTISFAVNVTGGNAVVVAIGRISGAGTYTVSDATNGTYPETCADGTGDKDGVLYVKRNVTGGFTNITFDVSSNDGNVIYTAWELSGVDNVSAIGCDPNDEGSATSHVCGGAGLTGTGFFGCAISCGASVDYTPGAGYTDNNDVTAVAATAMYAIKTGAGEQGPFTVSSATSCHPALILVPQSSGGGGGGSTHRARTLMGVG